MGEVANTKYIETYTHNLYCVSYNKYSHVIQLYLRVSTLKTLSQLTNSCGSLYEYIKKVINTSMSYSEI